MSNICLNKLGLLIEKGDIPCVRACRLAFLLDDAEIHLGGIPKGEGWCGYENTGLTPCAILCRPFGANSNRSNPIQTQIQTKTKTKTKTKFKPISNPNSNPNSNRSNPIQTVRTQIQTQIQTKTKTKTKTKFKPNSNHSNPIRTQFKPFEPISNPN